MNKFIKPVFTAITIIAALAFVSSCKKSFDNPPAYVTAVIVPTDSVLGFKTKHPLGSAQTLLITDDVVLNGIVIADDQSGNFYKQIIIQDGTGGILIDLNGNSLYTSYPIGMRLGVKCKGLYIGNFNGTLQLGAGSGLSSTGKSIMTGIPSTTLDKYLLKGTVGNVVTPKVVTTSQFTTALLDPLQNSLVKLEGFEFADADLGNTYADPLKVSTSAGSFNIKNCAGNVIKLYNSNYANFAGVGVPAGNGAITAVYTIYGTYKHLQIRDTTDL